MLAHRGIVADGDDAPVLDRQRLRDREAVVNGNDLAADKNDVGSFGCPRGSRN
jgi:hypothetical protein